MNTGSSAITEWMQRMFPRVYSGTLLPRISCLKSLLFSNQIREQEQEQQNTNPNTNPSQLNVALICTSFYELPPPTYAGLETFLYNLAVELAKLRGVHVTLIAPRGTVIPDSNLDMDIIETIKPAHDFSGFTKEKEAFDIYKPQLKDFDGIIHDHTWQALVYKLKKKNPGLKVCKTCHGMTCWSSAIYGIKNINMISPSRMHAEHIRQALHTGVKVIHHGINTDLYRFQPDKGERYLMLTRMEPEKGLDVFIDIIKRTGAKADIIGDDVFAGDVRYVDSIKSLCDGSQIKFYRGREITEEEKIKFIQNAKALVALPMLSRGLIEAWGLNVTEALSCGTPVIGFRNGGLIEQIEDGKTGFLCDTADEVEEVIRQNKVTEIDPKACRERAENRFSINTCTKSYYIQYANILQGKEW